jgi:hypothetical protein
VSAGNDPRLVDTAPSTPIHEAATVAYQGPSSTPPNDAPESIAGYRLIRALGRGGMGTVYEAEDAAQGRRVALKLVAPEVTAAPEALERFRQEGRLASAVAHPRCVFVLAADEEAGRPYIVMELMPGDTLADLVGRKGPLPVEEAVARALDVAEGLREAHRLGVIHRDVKPSNCFVESGGRVKVGDFGLSKSLGGESHLTRTGAFLGTPLYASPEQIKGEELDGRTDVYSAAATLYFLLTGKAPFDQKDAAATMARIVSDPAPSARAIRPEIPPTLDRAILKGLERDRDRRWRDMDEFADALRPFVDRMVPGGGIGLRVGAYLVDVLSLFLFLLIVELLPLHPVLTSTTHSVIYLLYFAISEGLWGASPGKRLARLRVYGKATKEPPGLPAAALRTAVFFALAQLPLVVFTALAGGRDSPSMSKYLAAMIVVETLGCAALASTMRWTSGLRGLHEVVSGTRVVGLPRSGRRLASAERRRPIGRDRGASTRPVGVLKSVGPYRVRGAVRWEADRKVLAGEDSTLGREVWVVLRPRGSPPPPPARRDLTRATRPRWIAGGEQAEGRWDAYHAPTGCPLADLAGPEGLSWGEARPILEDLADELAAACADGTLPSGRLTVDQVWVEPDGRAQLVDPLVLGDASGVGPAGQSDQARALSLLRRVAGLGLEGGRRRLDDEATAVRAPAPLHAARILGRLFGQPAPYEDVAALRADLAATSDLHTEVGVALRATHLGAVALVLSFALLPIFFQVYMTLGGEGASPGADEDPAGWMRFLMGLIIAAPALWVVWAFLTRGGFCLPLVGLGLVRSDGRPASRLHCAWRTFLAWVVPMGLLLASVWAKYRGVKPAALPWIFFGLAVAAVVAYIPLGLVYPARGPHDRLSGTYLVPK